MFGPRKFPFKNVFLARIGCKFVSVARLARVGLGAVDNGIYRGDHLAFLNVFR